MHFSLQEFSKRALVAPLEPLYRALGGRRIDWRRADLSAYARAVKAYGVARGWAYYLTSTRRRLHQMRDIHKGRRCFIICNGPSLNRTDLNLLADDITLGQNAIFLKFGDMSFLPSYYVAMDDLFIEDRHKEINSLAGLGMTRFLPIELAYCLDNSSDLVWMNCPDSDGDMGVPSFSKHPELFLFHGSTVTFICIQLAYHFGCDPVYLIGCDADYVQPKSVVEYQEGHWLSREDDPNHFAPDYFGKGYRWHDPRTELMVRSYSLARWIFEEADRKLLNATVGGRLEALERVDYESLFSPGSGGS